MRKQYCGNCVSVESVAEVFGEEVIKKLKTRHCDFTNRLMDDNDTAVEFTSSMEHCDDTFVYTLTAYYYQDQSDLDDCENLDELEWEIDCIEVQSKRIEK